MPNRHHTFVRDEVLPSWWANSIQSVLSTLAENFRLVTVDGSTTQIKVPAGPGDDLAALAIDGRWRFVEADVTRAHPGGAAGTYDVFATTAENNIVNAPLPNTDLTDYTFDLAIVAHGAQPVAVPGDVDLWRLIGDLDWDGVKITRLTQRVGAPDIGHGITGDFAVTGALSAASLSVGGRAIAGPVALGQRPVLDVGVLGHTRAGRVLTVADFTALGLLQPVGLFNLGDLTNLGSDGRALTNKGGVPFGKGITGAAAEAAVFAGSSAQALYIPDAGGGLDAFRLSAGGSWGCWFRTAKSGDQGVMGRWRDGGLYSYLLHIQPSNAIAAFWSPDGVTPFSLPSVTRVADDRWHFAVATHDGSSVRLYVDGALEAVAAATAATGTIFAPAVPLNIGGYAADAGVATSFPFYGRIDEAFVTTEILSEDQVRALYAVKLAHGFGAQPGTARVNVYRRRRGAAFVVGDFAAAPLRLYNFTGGSYGDAGSNNVGLSGNFGGGFIVNAPGADGTRAGAQVMGGAHTGIQATDAGLPPGTNARSYGLWFKVPATAAASMALMSYGTLPASRDVLFVNTGGIYQVTASDQVGGSPVADGAWHLAVVVIDNAAADGLRRKVYVDGALVASSTVLGALALGGGGHFRIGADVDASMPLAGSVDGVFVTNYALAREDVMRLYAKGAQQLAASPKNAGDHVEAMDATSVFFIGDTLEPQHLVDVSVAA